VTSRPGVDGGLVNNLVRALAGSIEALSRQQKMRFAGLLRERRDSNPQPQRDRTAEGFAAAHLRSDALVLGLHAHVVRTFVLTPRLGVPSALRNAD
jgi:hypothetical protein